MNNRFVAIEGNIGSGKTTLAKKLSTHWNARLVLEEFEDNPFLPRFYEDPRRHAFPLEMYFLAERFRQLSGENIQPDLFSRMTVSDYYLEKSLIFARNNLDDTEFQLFQRLYDIMFRSLAKPDLIVFLHLPVEQLLRNIKKRGRSYEQSITGEYLSNIQQIYMEHLATLRDFRILVLDYGNLDFAGSQDDFLLIEKVLNTDFPVGITRKSL
ncbi:MAG TPA: deoxynucleoside kinase [Flavobacteriales bacterium]|nr:deoxynucleoside kinase [Flavobacteriales bacterium]HRE98473.1 deoxynucleoside kinase [Flavobacteriales bacterium]HRJ37702.1 deoxynucleoside kinase [Flavobacteriales bacterium]